MPRSPVSDLSTTAYAVLGLLAMRPYTGYELTHSVRRTYSTTWPKEESLLYAQPAKLVAAGLATCTQEKANGRNRNRYAITPAGRKALRAWLATESAPPKLELEPLLRFSLSDHGELADARRAIATMRDWAVEQYAAGTAIGEEYVDGTAPFPERLHILSIQAELLTAIFQTVIAWADDADQELDRWKSIDVPGPDATTPKRMRRLMQEAREFLSR